MMFALGCIQALKCNTTRCPVGVATQDPELIAGLHVPTKAERVAEFQARTVAAALEIVGAIGLHSPRDLRPYHVSRRISGNEVRTFEELHPRPEPGSLLEGRAPQGLQRMWDLAGRRASA